MRKFIVELIVSVALITIGVSMCFFEFVDYDYVNYSMLEDKETLEYRLDEEHPLRLELDDDLYVRYVYDDTLSDHVQIEFNSMIRYKEYGDYIRFKDANGHWTSWKNYYQVFMDGLKDHHITIFRHDSFDDIDEIVIICKKENSKFIHIND